MPPTIGNSVDSYHTTRTVLYSKILFLGTPSKGAK